MVDMAAKRKGAQAAVTAKGAKRLCDQADRRSFTDKVERAGKRTLFFEKEVWSKGQRCGRRKFS